MQHVHEVLADHVEARQGAPDQARADQAGDAADQGAHQVVPGDRRAACCSRAMSAERR